MPVISDSVLLGFGKSLQAEGMSYEGTHPNALGYADIALAVAEALLHL